MDPETDANPNRHDEDEDDDEEDEQRNPKDFWASTQAKLQQAEKLSLGQRF
jgi:hypothetical protein